MSSNPALVLSMVYAIVACCSAGNNITAYVRETLTSTTCESVVRKRSVCNVDWKVPRDSAEEYEERIQSIDSIISSPVLTFGLKPSQAIHCRKTYETFMCSSSFPVCDDKKMAIIYGNVTERCELAKEACPTVSLQGCEYSTNGEKSIVGERKKCVPLEADTSKFCPNFKMKVPETYTIFANQHIQYLTESAETFEQQVKNRTGMEACRDDYNELLCRLIGACSPDGYYSLRLITKEECEEKMSCVKAAGLEKVDTTICSILPRIHELKDKKNITVRNPYFTEPLISTTPQGTIMPAAEKPTMPTAAENPTMPTAAENHTMPSAAENPTMPTAAEKTIMPSAAEDTAVSTSPPRNPEGATEILTEFKDNQGTEQTETISVMTRNVLQHNETVGASGKNSAGYYHYLPWSAMILSTFLFFLRHVVW